MVRKPAISGLAFEAMARWMLGILSLAACRPAPTAAAAEDAGPAPEIERDGGRPRVELTWRLFETRRWLEGPSRRESAVVELLVNGGTPSRIDLGRRDTAGCAVHDASGSAVDDDRAAVLTSLDCASSRAQVSRPRAPSGDPRELRVVAGDRAPPTSGADSAWTGERMATVRVPAAAEIAVDRELARIPDEAPGP
jgi:hypothetical protein